MYRLALEMKIWNVEEWSRSITTSQLRWWLAYYRVEPFGQVWRRAARMVSMLGAFWTGKYSDEAEEAFLPTYRKDRVQTEEEMLAELRKCPIFAQQMDERKT